MKVIKEKRDKLEEGMNLELKNEIMHLMKFAKQIKEEGELEERTFCNKSANKGAIKNEVL